jgi:hypothetical protein
MIGGHQGSTQPTRGIVFVAWGDMFIKEALESAAQLRKVMDLPITLITPEPFQPVGAIDTVINQPFKATYQDKILMRLSPYDETIFLDTDTFVLEPLDQIFQMLSKFDLLYQSSGPSLHYELPGVPMGAFEEPSAGLIAWRKCDAVERFFDLWTEFYVDQERVNGQGAWDQRSFRAALWHGDLRFHPLGRDWQLYSFEAGVPLSWVRMVHGRGRDAKAAIAECNNHIGPRVYIPRLGFFPSRDPAPQDYLKLSFLAAIQSVKRLTRLLLHWTGIWKLPTNQRPM